jgi:hypothetical protein
MTNQWVILQNQLSNMWVVLMRTDALVHHILTKGERINGEKIMHLIWIATLWCIDG